VCAVAHELSLLGKRFPASHTSAEGVLEASLKLPQRRDGLTDGGAYVVQLVVVEVGGVEGVEPFRWHADPDDGRMNMFSMTVPSASVGLLAFDAGDIDLPVHRAGSPSPGCVETHARPVGVEAPSGIGSGPDNSLNACG
jgi:hypothetical protein